MTMNTTTRAESIHDYPDLIWETESGKSVPWMAKYVLTRGIAPEVAEARGLVPIHNLRDWRLNDNAPPFSTYPEVEEGWFNETYVPLGIPLYSPFSGTPVTIQIRPERPHQIRGEAILDDKGKTQPDPKHGGVLIERTDLKFLLPIGAKRGSRPGCIPADVNPLAQEWMADDIDDSLPYVIGEGPTRGDAILSAALREDIRIVPISLTGVTMGVAAAGTEDNPGPEPILFPDTLGLLDWSGRRTYLAFDNDFRTKPRVRTAMLTLARLLDEAGADVRIIDTPGKPGTGIDDYLADPKSSLAAVLADADTFTLARAVRETTKYPRTDVGRGERLVEELRATDAPTRYIFNLTTGAPMRWTGKVWADDTNASILAFAAEIAKRDPEDTNGLSIRGLENAVKFARSCAPDLCVKADALDGPNSDSVMNFRNGCVNLLTGELGPFDPALRMTKIAPAAYIPGAAPVWEKFICESMCGDMATVGYIQRQLGAALFGTLYEELGHFWFGPKGNNGKSATINIIQAILGEYATTINTHIVMGKAKDEELMALKGVRVAYGNELEEGTPMAGAAFKKATSQGTMEGRQLHQVRSKWISTHSLIFTVNSLPVITNSDDLALQRRVRVVRWDNQVLAADRDEMLPGRLMLEMDQIVAWLIEGARLYAADGCKLHMSPAVEAATAEYLSGGDAISEFVDACLVKVHGINLSTKQSDVNGAYRAWCDDRGTARPIDAGKLLVALSNRNVLEPKAHKKVRGIIYWNGVRVRERATNGEWSAREDTGEIDAKLHAAHAASLSGKLAPVAAGTIASPGSVLDEYARQHGDRALALAPSDAVQAAGVKAAALDVQRALNRAQAERENADRAAAHAAAGGEVSMQSPQPEADPAAPPVGTGTVDVEPQTAARDWIDDLEFS